MRFGFFVAAITLSTGAWGQKMLPAAEWCAAGKYWPSAVPPPAGPDQRSDSIDIRTTIIRVDTLDVDQKLLRAATTVQFEAKVNGVSEIRLDLLNMTIDSVEGIPQSAWDYDQQRLHIAWPGALQAGDTAALTVWYHGHPVQDANGWGGFYWQGDYVFNLGVSFASDPHNFGRAWFPCFDNFVERCAFQFHITAPAGKRAFCNGAETARTALPDGRTVFSWAIDQPIPSYLACMAVGPYTAVVGEYAGENGPIPIEIAVSAADSNNLKASFVHLPNALATFEHWYGPYRWNKVGYSIVPFQQGAMEHATNIAYMQIAANGNTAYETLFAHELSHHWWGDLATCSTEGDMWLNEGWAVYSEHLFLEALYGPDAYHNAVRNNFLDVLENAHVNEDGYRAVSGIPHKYTYGQHVYNKGAVVAHNLRGYLGDSLFRAGLREALAGNQLADWSSAGFRDKLSAATGYDLTHFFDDWVFSPGFAHFSVDSFQTVLSPVDAPTQVTVYVKQKRRGAPQFYQQVPLEFTFIDPAGNREYRSAMVSGETDTVQFEFPSWYYPVRVWVNTRQRLTLARADDEFTAKEPTSLTLAQAKLILKINTLPADTARIRVEHNYAMPDTAGNANPAGFCLSDRYWTVDAFDNFDGDGTFIYDGRGKLDQLDTELFGQTGSQEDSMVLLFRAGPGHPWAKWPGFVKNTLGSNTDRYGTLRALHLLPGQYTVGKICSTTVATHEARPAPLAVTIAPNPTRDRLWIQSDQRFNHVVVYTLGGVKVTELSLAPVTVTMFSTAGWPAGTYRIVLVGEKASGSASFQKLP